MKQIITRGMVLCIIMCAVFFATLLMHIPVFAQPLSGEYTIGTGGNFTTISDAIDVLNNEGRTGPVTFSIFAGTYEEQFTITSHTGMSEENPVVFKTHSGNPGDVKIAYAAESNGDNYIVRIQSASYITIRDLAFVATGSSHGTIVRLEGASHSNISLLENFFQGVPDGGSIQPFAIVHATAELTENTVISGNTFEGGSNSIYMRQNSHGARTVISDNVSSGATRDAFYLERQTAPLVSGNVITHSGSFYAIQLRECNYNLEILGNRIDISGESRVGILLRASEGHPLIEEQWGLIANNFITVRGFSSGVAGIRLTDSKVQNIYHNSIHVINSNSNSQGLHLPGTGNEKIRIVNNSFSNTGHSFQPHLPGGYAIGIDHPPAVLEMDYNNIFSTGNYLARWGNLDITDLASLKVLGNEGRNANSISVFPHYRSHSDLHTISPWLAGRGTPLGRVSEDIDGEPRSLVAPDIGADEFTPDPSTTTPMAGTYTIGTGGDYPSFTTAVDDLLLKGLSSGVIFEVLPGMYNERLTIFEFPSDSDADSIVFRSQTQNPDDVILHYEAEGGSDDFVINLRATRNVVLRDLTISANTASTANHARVIFIQGYSSGLRIVNNTLLGTTMPNTSIPAHALIYAEPVLSDSIIIAGHTFRGGSYSAYLVGVSAEVPSTRTFVINNLSSVTGHMVFRLKNQAAPIIRANTTTPGGYGIYLEACNGPTRITKNKIDVNGTDNGIVLISCSGGDSPEARMLIANNFVTHRGGNNIRRGAIEIVNTDKVDVVFNSINSLGPLSPSLHISENASDINVLNNILVNSGGGYAYSVPNPSAINRSHNNNIYTDGDKFALWDGDRVDIDELRVASGKEQNSISADPGFISINDLHVRTAAGDSAGFYHPLVIDDIDGELRDTNFPDIGADEFIFRVNHAPVITSVPDSVAYVDSLYQYQIFADDQDGDTLTFSLITAPDFLLIEESTGLVEGTPSSEDVGEHSVEIQVDDGNGNRVNQHFTLSVAIPTGITDGTNRIPDSFKLYQNYPNPFNPSTIIRYTLPQSSHVRIEVFNVAGQRLLQLIDEEKPAGLFNVVFNASHLASGVYFYRIVTGEFTETKKMMLIR
jgi:pectin methylesterase-like acyl-CoA thioesterase